MTTPLAWCRLSVMVTMNAVSEPLLSPPHAIPHQRQLCVWLAGLLCMLLNEGGSWELDTRVYQTGVAAFKQALVSLLPAVGT